MKFNPRKRNFIGAVIMAILAGFGLANTQTVAPVLTELTCEAVGCDDGSTTGG